MDRHRPAGLKHRARNHLGRGKAGDYVGGEGDMDTYRPRGDPTRDGHDIRIGDCRYIQRRAARHRGTVHLGIHRADNQVARRHDAHTDGARTNADPQGPDGRLILRGDIHQPAGMNNRAAFDGRSDDAGNDIAVTYHVHGHGPARHAYVERSNARLGIGAQLNLAVLRRNGRVVNRRFGRVHDEIAHQGHIDSRGAAGHVDRGRQDVGIQVDGRIIKARIQIRLGLGGNDPGGNDTRRQIMR